MNDGKRISVVVLDKRPIAYRRKVYARFSGVNETARRFSENFAVFISYEAAVPVDRGHASHVTVRSPRLRSFVLKPLIKSESSQFHSKLSGLVRLDCRLATAWVSARANTRVRSVVCAPLSTRWGGHRISHETLRHAISTRVHP